MTQPEITIHSTRIPCTDDKWRTDRLVFLSENPRVYSSIADIPDFDDLHDDQKQQVIYRQLLKERSVRTLIPDIRDNGGLIEPILVRADTREVVEGNSRLAAYRHLYSESKDEKWNTIPCRLVSSLTDDQLAALLHSIHVKGKTSWTTYEKAHFTYLQHKKGKRIEDIAKLFSISTSKAYQDVRIIKAMKENSDSDRAHFSYYSVLKTSLRKELRDNTQLESALLSMIRRPDDGGDHHPPFTAQNLRDQLPVVLRKPKILRKFVKGEITLDTAHDRAKISDTQSKMKRVRGLLNDVTHEELRELGQPAKKAVDYECRKVQKELSRIQKMLAKMMSS